MMLTEAFSLVLATVTGVCSADVLRRPLVDGSQGLFVPTAGALVLLQPVAANQYCAGGFYLVGCGHWERLLVCLLDCHGTPHPDPSHPSGEKPTYFAQAAPMHLSPIKRLLAIRSVQTQRHHCLHVGLMLVLAGGSSLITRNLSTGLERSAAEPPGNRRHRHRETD